MYCIVECKTKDLGGSAPTRVFERETLFADLDKAKEFLETLKKAKRNEKGFREYESTDSIWKGWGIKSFAFDEPGYYSSGAYICYKAVQ